MNLESGFAALAIKALDNSHAPFPYQVRIAEEQWPGLLKIPTGLGKTSAIGLAWAYKRIQGDPHTPRRLVWCLPMRTLVEQTAENVAAWLENIHKQDFTGKERLPSKPHVLMGGEADNREWLLYPEKPAILIGTQDVLLSRALMRGYGVSRARWPVDFALLHNDAMWVFDEVQLMAAGAPTSAQFEAFRRKIDTMADCRSLWMSATLERGWLDTVDLDVGAQTLHSLEAEDRADPIVRKRLGAAKALTRAETAVTADVLKGKGLEKYSTALAEDVLSKHRPGKTTLVIVNRVDRAQALYAILQKKSSDDRPFLLLVHSRFRPTERAELNKQLTEAPGVTGRIVVATQAVEAGVDVTSAVMFTELAPWASLVQRFGRLNRGGEEADAQAYWINIETEDAKAAELSLPYTATELDAARKRLNELNEVSPQKLESFELDLDARWHVLRRKDLYELFDTDPDLTGFDVDVSCYVRGADDTDVRVFWRQISNLNFGPQGEEARRPHRDEICAVPIGQAKKWLNKKKDRAFTWDWVEKRWRRLDALFPGALVLVDAELGGYDPERGFTPLTKALVEPVELQKNNSESPDGLGADPDTVKNTPVALPDHLRHVRDYAQALCDALSIPHTESEAVATAALWHDLGKTHDVFKARCGLSEDDDPLAKSPHYNWRRKDGRNRDYFRHELVSALVWLAHGPEGETHDLIAYLIAAHHGKVRMGLRAVPGEQGPDDNPNARFARGVWDGDALPALSVNGLSVPGTELRLDVMELGGGAKGQSWAARTHDLLERYGPFRLAFLEALVRIADWRASEVEQQDTAAGDATGSEDEDGARERSAEDV